MFHNVNVHFHPFYRADGKHYIFSFVHDKKKVSNPSDQKLVEYKNKMLFTNPVKDSSYERPGFHSCIPEINNINILAINTINDFAQVLDRHTPKMQHKPFPRHEDGYTRLFGRRSMLLPDAK